MSQSVETQLKRTSYPTAAGILMIVSACLQIILYSLVSLRYGGFPSYIFLIELVGAAISIMLGIIALLGGVFALTRTRFVFAVFGSSILIVHSLGGLTYFFELLMAPVIYAGNFIINIYTVLFLTIPPIVLVLSILGLVFLAKSRNEFS